MHRVARRGTLYRLKVDRDIAKVACAPPRACGDESLNPFRDAGNSGDAAGSARQMRHKIPFLSGRCAALQSPV